MRRKALIALQRVIVRTERGPLRPVWAALYAGVTHIVATYLCFGRRGAAAYVARSIAMDDPVYGLSDIDLVVVVPDDRSRRGDDSMRLRRRWQRLCRVIPPLGEHLLPDVAFYEDGELAEAMKGSVFTYGLDPGGSARADRPAFRGSAPMDEFGLRSRPGVYGPTRDWRLVRAPDRRPPISPLSRQDQRIAAWQELQFWWSFAFEVAADPDQPWSASLCVKLVAEPARIWLALTEGAVIPRRRDVLRRALVRLPDEGEAIAGALELHDRLGRGPAPPLAETLPAFVRLTGRVAGRLRKELDRAGQTSVRLVTGAEPRPLIPAHDGSSALNGQCAGLLPLVDWRALANPTLPDEAFRVVAGDPGCARDLGRAARARSGGPYPALRADGLLILPALGVWGRSYLRAVQCQPTDPVSLALADGLDVARFYDVPGWCARDWARRAVSEHRAEVSGRPGPWSRRPDWPEVAAAPPRLRALAKLLTAARAGLFLDSIEAGDPELPLTAAAVAGRLSERGTGARTVAESALEAYRSGFVGGAAPPGDTVAALRALVMMLPAYAGTP